MKLVNGMEISKHQQLGGIKEVLAFDLYNSLFEIDLRVSLFAPGVSAPSPGNSHSGYSSGVSIIVIQQKMISMHVVGTNPSR